MRRTIPLLLVAACSPTSTTREVPVSFAPGEAVRISYFHIARRTSSGETLERYLVLTSTTWAQRHGDAAWEPYGRRVVPARSDSVPDDEMGKLLQGLTQAGLTTFPECEPPEADPATFRGTVVTIQTETIRKAYLLRDPTTGAFQGDRKAVLMIDAIMNAAGNAYALKLDTRVGKPR